MLGLLFNHETDESIARIMPALVKTRHGTEDDKASDDSIPIA